MAERTKNERG